MTAPPAVIITAAAHKLGPAALAQNTIITSCMTLTVQAPAGPQKPPKTITKYLRTAP
jgi:hypothetical protein